MVQHSKKAVWDVVKGDHTIEYACVLAPTARKDTKATDLGQTNRRGVDGRSSKRSRVDVESGDEEIGSWDGLHKKQTRPSDRRRQAHREVHRSQLEMDDDEEDTTNRLRPILTFGIQDPRGRGSMYSALGSKGSTSNVDPTSPPFWTGLHPGMMHSGSTASSMGRQTGAETRFPHPARPSPVRQVAGLCCGERWSPCYEHNQRAGTKSKRVWQ